MEIKFEKYNGLGNDFIITEYDLDGEVVSKLCNRHFGIGADGLIVSKKENDVYFMKFFNSDGSIAPMCGNGIRCYTHYLYRNNLIKGDININTLSGVKNISYNDSEEFLVKVDMGKASDIKLNNKIEVLDKVFKYHYVFTGTDHIVIFIDENELNEDFVNRYGSLISNRKDIFEKGTNVNFVSVLDNTKLKLITYERGVGMTLACGTGAVASAYISNLLSLCDKDIETVLLGGNLKIEIKETIFMIGKSEFVFEGSVNI